MINWSRRLKIIRKTSFDLVFKIVYERRKQTKVNLLELKRKTKTRKKL